MIPKEFEAVGKEDIDAVVANAVVEGRRIEYKEQLPGGVDDDKREFLADASSFANAGGGDLIFGVREKRDAAGKTTGVPEAAVGLAGINADAEKRRLEDMLRAGIDPRIPGIRIKHVEGFPLGPVILLRTPKSWASPHMVIFKNLSRFFSRTSAGKHQLDVTEIRASFSASESLAERISAFRSDRVGKILVGETPLPLEAGARFVLHLLPVRSFAEALTVDLHVARALLDHLRPMATRFQGIPRFNFSGLLVHSANRSSPPIDSYIQVFRNGAMEAVCTRFARDGSLVGNLFEQEVLDGVRLYLKAQQNLGVGPPVFLAISVLEAKGLPVAVIDEYSPGGILRGTPIADEVLMAPEVLIEEFGAGITGPLLPVFHTIWQASGWPRSMCYDDEGKKIELSRYRV